MSLLPTVSRASGDSHPADQHSHAMVQSDPTRPRNVFAEQTRQTQCIVLALNARKAAINIHGLSVDEQLLPETVMRDALDLFKESFIIHCEILRRENEPGRQYRRRVRSALNGYIFRATGLTFAEFWQDITTNQISEIDRANIARYEDAIALAQRERTAAITAKLIKLGVCIALAWKRGRQGPEALK